MLLNSLIQQRTKTAVLMIGIDRNTVKIDKTSISFGKPAMIGAGISVRFGIATGQGGMHAPPAQAFVSPWRGPLAGFVSSIGLRLLTLVAR